ncbi:hypothetical protein PENSUB_13089 [Penicillium subrubescens]|uniref:DUF202 domain-containing protein n=1 Tax=Penicillium subrubescens TaxID=1316194 RepID=A0A1Q5STY8_9EURO|nr:hypothetical protein PENSUB_13089 [Penicillium subrubescens]
MTTSPRSHRDFASPASASMIDTRGSVSTPRAQPGERRESLELRELQTREDEEQLGYSSPSASSGEDYRVTTRRRSTQSTTVRRASDACKGKGKGKEGTWKSNRIAQFWTQHVTLTVPQRSNRDHFALERTLLAYIRTSVVIAMQGVLIAQLFRLQQPGDRLKFYVAGKPLAVTCHCVAILVALIGAYRFWRQQGAISLGKVHAGGWELNAVGILICAVSMRDD